MSKAALAVDDPAVAAASSEAGALPTKAPKTSKRPKAIKRRGAKVEDDEEEEDSSRPTVADDGASDSSGSDFSGPDDDDEDDDDDASDTEAVDASTPVAAVVEPLASVPSPASVEEPAADSPAPLIGQPGHPSWADVPEGGESELPTLDFAALTPATLAQVPAQASRAATPLASADGAAPLSKKAQMLAKREAKFAALKAKDPVAFEQMEVDRKARELAKKREKKERKRLERTAPGTQSHNPANPAPPVEDAAPGVPDTSRPAPPHARPARGAVPSRPSRTAQSGLLDPSHPPSSNTPGPGASAAPQFQRGERRGPPNGGPYPPPEYVNAREAYAARLAADPSYTPRVGRFWSHDDRLAPQELRPLTNNWRGRGGRGRGGGDGMRGGRGGLRGGREGSGPPQGYNPGWDTSAGTGEGGAPHQRDPAAARGSAQSTDQAEHAPTPPPVKVADTDAEDDDEDDGWGRGEAKRKLRPSFPAGAPAAIPAWSHDGFDELKQSEPNRPPRGAGGAGRGRGGRAHGPPGSINPAYANLPFHPQHRFPIPPPEETTMTSLPTAEQDLFEPPNGPQSVVRLPGSGGAVDASLADQTATLTIDHDPRGVVVNMGGRSGQQPVTVYPRTAEELEAEHEERRRGGASILYAADPERLARIPQDPFVGHYPHPHAPPMQHYQLPPHLQAQAQAQAQFIPRHASPAYYPQQYYSPDAFPNMPTPGATPPPPLFPGAQAANFFVPPRHSKIEIKAPGPSHSPSLHKSNLSATGGAFQPGAPAHVAASFHQQQGSPASSPSPQLFADPNTGYYAHPEQVYYEQAHEGQYQYDQQAYWNEQNYAQQNYGSTYYPHYQGQGY